MEKRRLGAQDAAKGLMIIGVIFFHSFMMTLANPSDVINTFNPLVLCFPFLLSTFFFYAGYNYVPSEKTYGQHIARRAKQLLIPMAIAFVVSSLLISAMELAFHANEAGATFRDIGNSILYSLMSEPLAWMVGFPKEGGLIFELYLSLSLLWFLYALFICSLFFYLLVKFTNQRLWIYLVTVLGLLALAFCLGQFVGVYLPYTVQCYPVILAIMLTGAYLRKFDFLEREVKSKKDIALHGLFALLSEGAIVGIGLLCYYQWGAIGVGSLPGGKFDGTIKGFDAFIAFSFGILGTFFLHTLCRALIRIPLFGKAIQWVGQHSAFFYLFHPIFLELVGIAFFQKRILWGIGQAFFYVAVVVLLLTGVCLLIDLLKKKKRPTPADEPQKEGEEAPHE